MLRAAGMPFPLPMWRRLCAATAAAISISPAFGENRYTLDNAHSIPQFEFSHLGLTTQTGRFDRANGYAVLNVAARSGSVLYEVDTNSLNMGFGTESPDSPGYQLFRVTRFPKIVFRSSHVVFNDAGDVVAAKGRLTMLGVSRPLTVDVRGFKCSIHPVLKREMCAGEISAVIMRSQFGMMKYIPGISDKITVTVPIEAYKD